MPEDIEPNGAPQPELKGIVSYAARQSLTSFASSRDELCKNGVDIELRQLGLSPIKSFIADCRFLFDLRFAKADFAIINSGIFFMRRARVLQLALRIVKKRGLPAWVLWRNAASKFVEIRKRHGEEHYARALELMRDPYLSHLAISDETARNVADEIGCEMPTNILNCRSMPAKYLEPVEPDEPPIVLNAASVIARKAPDIFTDVAIATCKVHPTVRFWWLGGEGPEAELAKIREAGLEDRIEFKPFDPDPFAYMQRSSVFLLTSREEGFGLVLAEAMACSRTVVSFSGTGAAEVAGDTGIVVPNGDVAATSEALLSVLSKPREDRVNHAARELYMELYSPAAYAARLAGILRASLASQQHVAAHKRGR